MGQPGEESYPPRALLYRPMIPPTLTTLPPLPTSRPTLPKGTLPQSNRGPSLITRMAEAGEEHKEGDGSDMPAFEGDEPLEGNGLKKDVAPSGHLVARNHGRFPARSDHAPRDVPTCRGARGAQGMRHLFWSKA